VNVEAEFIIKEKELKITKESGWIQNLFISLVISLVFLVFPHRILVNSFEEKIEALESSSSLHSSRDANDQKNGANEEEITSTLISFK
jgi:hypothetical protein